MEIKRFKVYTKSHHHAFQIFINTKMSVVFNNGMFSKTSNMFEMLSKKLNILFLSLGNIFKNLGIHRFCH